MKIKKGVTMNQVINRLFRKASKPTQQEVVDFASDKKTIEKAALGSMQKRNDLLERVKLKHA